MGWEPETMHSMRCVRVKGEDAHSECFYDTWHYTAPIALPWAHQAIQVMTNDMSQLVQLVDYVRKFQKPNVYGARIPLHTAWNVHLMQQLAESTSDREVVQFMIFGWSLNHNGAPVTISTFNHPSADRHPDVMNDYIRKEFAHGCLLGPFVTPPWTGAVAVSPMSTRPKKDPGKRRVIMDLSWPHNGRSVNDGIPKDRYLEQVIDLQYPTIDTLCK